MDDVSHWFNRLPPMTKVWFGGTVAFSLIGRFGVISHSFLILDFYKFIYKFHFWRPITCLFYYPILGSGLHFLFTLYFLYRYSLALETEEFARRPADYLFMLLFNWICCITVALIGNVSVLMDPMVMSVTYVWCQLNKDVIVSFWFGVRFKAMYLPWVILGISFIIFGGGVLELLGIIVGHLYFFLTISYPQEFGGPSLLHTPEFLRSFFPNQRMSGFGQAPTAREGGADREWPRGLFQGRGNTLN